MLDVQRLIGFTVCAVAGCACGAAVPGGSTGDSTGEDAVATRETVRRVIEKAGLPLPRFLK